MAQRWQGALCLPGTPPRFLSPPAMKAALLSPASGVFLFVRYAAAATLLMVGLNAAI